MRDELKSVKTKFRMKLYPWEKERETKSGLHATDVSHASHGAAGMCTRTWLRAREVGPMQNKTPLSLIYRKTQAKLCF